MFDYLKIGNIDGSRTVITKLYPNLVSTPNSAAAEANHEQ
jgi:hypothetical protein